jgi:predicted glycosyltransferase
LRVLFDITHPAYVHFFREVIPELRAMGHEVEITSRDKDVTLPLLDARGLAHICLTRAGRSRPQLLRELIVRNWKLVRVIRRFRPHVIIGCDSVCGCHAGWLTGTPSISFDFDDDAHLAHKLYFRFATRVYTDESYRKRIGPRQRLYRGVFSLAYLHPDRFHPDLAVVERLKLQDSERLILCRLVSWTANHDYGHRGQLVEAIDELATFGRLVITSEVPLPSELERHRLSIKPEDLHSVLSRASLYVGESATMAIEAAVLGIPAIHVSTRSVAYTNDLELRYGLVHNFTDPLPAVDFARKLLADSSRRETYRRRRDAYLDAVDDVRNVVIESILEFAGHAAPRTKPVVTVAHAPLHSSSSVNATRVD